MIGSHKSACKVYQPVFFTATEWRFINAACNRLIPSDELGPGATELGVPEFIDWHMTTPYGAGSLWFRQAPYFKAPAAFGYQGPLSPREILRHGIAGTDTFCETRFGTPFFMLDASICDDVLLQLERDLLLTVGVSSGCFFTILLSEVRVGFFSDPAYGGNRGMEGWRLIGYPGFPDDYRQAVTERDAGYSVEPKSFPIDLKLSRRIF